MQVVHLSCINVGCTQTTWNKPKRWDLCNASKFCSFYSKIEEMGLNYSQSDTPEFPVCLKAVLCSLWKMHCYTFVMFCSVLDFGVFTDCIKLFWNWTPSFICLLNESLTMWRCIFGLSCFRHLNVFFKAVFFIHCYCYISSAVSYCINSSPLHTTPRELEPVKLNSVSNYLTQNSLSMRMKKREGGWG